MERNCSVVASSVAATVLDQVSRARSSGRGAVGGIERGRRRWQWRTRHEGADVIGQVRGNFYITHAPKPEGPHNAALGVMTQPVDNFALLHYFGRHEGSSSAVNVHR